MVAWKTISWFKIFMIEITQITWKCKKIRFFRNVPESATFRKSQLPLAHFGCDSWYLTVLPLTHIEQSKCCTDLEMRFIKAAPFPWILMLIIIKAILMCWNFIWNAKEMNHICVIILMMLFILASVNVSPAAAMSNWEYSVNRATTTTTTALAEPCWCDEIINRAYLKKPQMNSNETINLMLVEINSTESFLAT